MYPFPFIFGRILEMYDSPFCFLQVAWLYNIRGSDVDYCPVVHAFAIVTIHSAFLYVDMKKVTSEVSRMED